MVDSITTEMVEDDWWKQNFRMSRNTYNIVCSELRPHLEKQVTCLRLPISVEERVAVTIWKLATNIEYRTLSALFGLGRSILTGQIVMETCQAISTHFLPRYVQIPQGDLLKEIVEGFEVCWGFPQTARAIDGTHITIIRPLNSASDYYNRKCFYSVIVQALVDHRGHFMDVYIGWPGKVHDARVFVNSTLYRKGNSGKLFPDWKKDLCGIQVPLVILGDPAYPALPWLMKPFADNAQTTTEQKVYNYHQSRALMTVENAFGRLKGRWRCLLKCLDCKLENVNKVVASCITLHNLCEKFGDACLPEWTQHGEPCSPSPMGHSGQDAPDATSIRNAIMQYICMT